MTPTETVAFLRNYNVWRRGNLDDQPMPDPREIGEAIDAAVEMIDRLEAAESNAAHQKALAESALRVAEGWEEKCNALRAEIIHIKEVEFPRKAQAVADGWRGKCERLEAKIAEMEKQEPVAWLSKQYGFVYMSRHPSQLEHGSILYLRNGAPAWRIEGGSKVALLDIASLPHGTVFYTLLGSKGEEK